MRLNLYILLSLALHKGSDLSLRAGTLKDTLRSLPLDELEQLGLSVNLAEAELELDQLLKGLSQLRDDSLTGLLGYLDSLRLTLAKLGFLLEPEIADEPSATASLT